MSVMEGRTTSALLYLDGVHVSFDGFHAINNLSLTLEPGEMPIVARGHVRARVTSHACFEVHVKMAAVHSDRT